MKETDAEQKAGMESPEDLMQPRQTEATKSGSVQAQAEPEVQHLNGDLQHHRPQPFDSDGLQDAEAFMVPASAGLTSTAEDIAALTAEPATVVATSSTITSSAAAVGPATSALKSFQYSGVHKPDKKTLSFFWHTLMPFILMVGAPSVVLCGASFVVTHGSSTSEAFQHGFKQFVYKAWTEEGTGTVDAWQFTIVYILYSGLSIQALAGKPFHGLPTSTGHRPVYWHSGFTYYLLTMEFAIFFLLFQRLPCYYIYEGLPGFSAVLVIVGLIVSLLLYVKAKVKPSPGEHGSTGSVVFDFFWGLELYPRIGAVFDVKLWAKGRFGMMLWQLLVLTCWKAQVETTGWNWAMTATACIQTAYIGKYFFWEHGYMKAMHNTFDRAGFYQCWGSIGFLSPVYALTSFYMVKNSPDISPVSAVFITALGVAMIMLTYWSDYQKQTVRDTEGDCTIWGSAPKAIKAMYQDASGKERTNLLLVSGFWSLCRHPNYFFEMLSGLCWVLPSGRKSIFPYMFVVYLMIHLTLRAHRFEQLCSKKYGEHWKTYCSLVKYRIIPYVF